MAGLRLLTAVLVALAATIAAGPARATVYYVGLTNASDGGLCTSQAAPCASIQGGYNKANAGDVVNVLPGTYNITSNATASNSGLYVARSGGNGSPITVQANDPTNHPVMNMAGLNPGATSNVYGIAILASWITVKNIDVANSPSNGTSAFGNGISVLSGSTNVIIDGPVVTDSKGVGIQVTGTGINNITIQHCDVFRSTHPSQPGEADGMEVINMDSSSTGIVVRDCRIDYANDDGIDLWGMAAPVELDRLLEAHAGLNPDGNPSGDGTNGTGIKMGDPSSTAAHFLHNSVSCENHVSGINSNGNTGAGTYYNNLAFGSTNVEFSIYSGTHHVRNNVAVPQSDEFMQTGVDHTFNSWDLQNLTVDATDFTSLTCASLFATKRNADGTLPAAVLAVGAPTAVSRVIDRGTNVGLPFIGTAPDLGAKEFDATTDAVGDAKTQQATIVTRLGQMATALTNLAASWAYDATALDANGRVVEPRGPAMSVPAPTIAGTVSSLQAQQAAAATANATLANDLANITSAKAQKTDAQTQQTAITSALATIATQTTSLAGTTVYTPGLRDAAGHVVLARDPSLVAPTWQVQAISAAVAAQRAAANIAAGTLLNDLNVLP